MARAATITFERNAANVRVARAFATRLADLVLPQGRVLGDQEIHALALMVSELATNAVEHGDGAITVRLAAAPRLDGAPGLRVEIDDAGAGLPVRRYSMPGALSGRGLEIVERLAVSWGWEPTEAGKTVWFEC